MDSGQWPVDSGQWTVDRRLVAGFAEELSEGKKRPVYGALIILKFYVSASRMQNIALNPNDVHDGIVQRQLMRYYLNFNHT